MPDIWAAAERAVSEGTGEGDALVLGEEAFAAAPRSSLDYALMEKSDRVATIPVTFDWRDIGNWNSVYEALVRTPREISRPQSV